jgi:hypothetical protein
MSPELSTSTIPAVLELTAAIGKAFLAAKPQLRSAAPACVAVCPPRSPRVTRSELRKLVDLTKVIRSYAAVRPIVGLGPRNH